MKNNIGMTIVELITSIVLVSIILVFMLNLLITLQYFGVQNQNETDLLVNQAVIIKALEKDINEFKLKGVSNCTIDDLIYSHTYIDENNKEIIVYNKYPVVPEEIYKAALKRENNQSLNADETKLLSHLYCLKLIFDNTLIEDNIGYLVQYSYNYDCVMDENKKCEKDKDGKIIYDQKNVVGYKRASNQTIRESIVKMNSNDNKGKVTTSCNNDEYDYCSLKIVLPIYDESGNNYDIRGTYIYKKNEFIYNSTPENIKNDYGFILK